MLPAGALAQSGPMRVIIDTDPAGLLDQPVGSAGYVSGGHS